MSTAIDQLFAGTSNKDYYDNSGDASESARRSYFGRVAYDLQVSIWLSLIFVMMVHIFSRQDSVGAFSRGVVCRLENVGREFYQR